MAVCASASKHPPKWLSCVKNWPKSWSARNVRSPQGRQSRGNVRGASDVNSPNTANAVNALAAATA